MNRSNPDLNDEDSDNALLWPSKSELKRQAHQRQALGEELIQLPLNRLQQLPLPEELLQAVLAAQQIHSHSAIKRQRQFIGKLLRRADPDSVATLAAALEQLTHQQQQNSHAHHWLEQWRERLVTSDNLNRELQQLVEELGRPVNLQPLRQLINHAKKEQQRQAAPKAARELFRYLRQLREGEI
ncbi:DUF615 domain-containing protein [Ectothiorhodospiraceae bacterium BW-2]|nr:DUF615 domain-containing protein [Ectothiorhodospiraceae bacterium BW-2]